MKETEKKCKNCKELRSQLKIAHEQNKMNEEHYQREIELLKAQRQVLIEIVKEGEY